MLRLSFEVIFVWQRREASGRLYLGKFVGKNRRDDYLAAALSGQLCFWTRETFHSDFMNKDTWLHSLHLTTTLPSQPTEHLHLTAQPNQQFH